MPDDGTALVSLLLGFLLVGARITGAFYFIPFPGGQQFSGQAKALLIIAITLSMYSFWPAVEVNHNAIGLIVSGILKEATVGVCMGLVVSLVIELLTFGFHLVGLQAGYTFASTVDPTSKADVTVMDTLGNLMGGLLFFTAGLHQEVIRAFAVSLKAHAAGSWTIGPGVIEPLVRLFQVMLSTGLRLALPVIAAMIMIDLALALIGRISSHLQLLSLSFPVKMLASLLMLAWLLSLIPSVFLEFAEKAFETVRQAIGA